MEGVPIVQLRTGRLTDGRSDLGSGPFRRRARSGAGRPRRSDGTQAVDTHVVDVTRPRQLVSNLILIYEGISKSCGQARSSGLNRVMTVTTFPSTTTSAWMPNDFSSLNVFFGVVMLKVIIWVKSKCYQGLVGKLKC